MAVIFSLLKFGLRLLLTFSSFLDTLLQWCGLVLSRFVSLDVNTRKRVILTLLLALSSVLVYRKYNGNLRQSARQSTDGRTVPSTSRSLRQEQRSNGPENLRHSGSENRKVNGTTLTSKLAGNALRTAINYTYPQASKEAQGEGVRRFNRSGSENGFTKKVGFQAILVPQKGYGADFQILYFQPWGLQVGAAYFPKDGKANETVSASWNLKGLTKFTENTSLIVVGSYTRKEIMGGLRINL